jgi:hypothetical protein
VHIRGTIAWVAWLALHLVTLLGNRKPPVRPGEPGVPLPDLGHGGAVIVDSDPPLPGLGSEQA